MHWQTEGHRYPYSTVGVRAGDQHSSDGSHSIHDTVANLHNLECEHKVRENRHRCAMKKN